jgi:diphthamide biosynthesis protein 7
MVRLSSSSPEKQATQWSLAGTRTSMSLGSLRGIIGTGTLFIPVRSLTYSLSHTPFFRVRTAIHWGWLTIQAGGDDLALKSWDARTLPRTLPCTMSLSDPPSPAPAPAPTSTNRRTFSGGVTAIKASPHQPRILAVGAYDATVRIFDMRSVLRPVCEADVGGGAWRVKFHPSTAAADRTRDVLVAAMHAGCRVVRFGRGVMGGDDDGREGGNETPSETDEWRIVKTFEKHQSMAYGVDWSYQSVHSGAGETLVGSCSFYDHNLYLWRG